MIKGTYFKRYFGTSYERFLGKSIRKSAEAIVSDMTTAAQVNAGIEQKMPSSILITTPLTAEYYRHSIIVTR
jgi:hypothetical protein